MHQLNILMRHRINHSSMIKHLSHFKLWIFNAQRKVYAALNVLTLLLLMFFKVLTVVIRCLLFVFIINSTGCRFFHFALLT